MEASLKTLREYAKWAEKKSEAESNLQGALFNLLDELSPETIDVLVNRIAPPGDEVAQPVEYLRHRMAMSYLWSCRYTNPLPNCVYNEREDPRHDRCVFCGHPEERK